MQGSRIANTIITNKGARNMTTQIKVTDIETITWHDTDTWHCQKCNTYIDDKIDEMEMHECKQRSKEHD